MSLTVQRRGFRTVEETGTRSYLKLSMITNATESDFLQGNFFPGFSDDSTLLIKVVKGFDQRPQKIFLTSLIRKANNLIGKCIETAQFSEFATFFLVYKVTFRKDLTR